MSFAANEDVTTLFEKLNSPEIPVTERLRFHSGGIQTGSGTLSESPAGKRSVRDVGAGSGNIDSSAAPISMLSDEQR